MCKRCEHGGFLQSQSQLPSEILKSQFPQLNGLRLTLYQEIPSNEPTQIWLQILHYPQQDHWITATTIGCSDGLVKIYDSVYRHLDEPTIKLYTKIFQKTSKLR